MWPSFQKILLLDYNVSTTFLKQQYTSLQNMELYISEWLVCFHFHRCLRYFKVWLFVNMNNKLNKHLLLCNPVKQNTTNCSRNKFKAQKAKLWGKYQPLKKEGCFVNFVLFTRDRTLTNETQLNCFISLSYSLIYIRCVKSYSAKFVRNHSLIRYFLHFDWLLPSTDLKGSFKVALIM